ncbi:MAG: M28 family peptidase [Planctomycetota bacterium]
MDEHGNLEIVYGKGRPALWFACHTDHPALRVDGKGTAVIEGGIRADALVGARLRTFDADVHPTVTKVLERGAHSGGRVKLKGAVGLKKGTPLVLDLPGVSFAGGKVRARAIDDLCAVAACLAVIDTLTKKRWEGSVGFLFTRAEEVGFAGALGWTRSTKLSRRSAIVNLEMSPARPHTPQGKGPILRIGDRITIFDDGVSLALEQCAMQLQKKHETFAYQRALMDGGACEATVYARAGFRAGALCLPLKNYHNHAPRGRTGPEYVARADAENLVLWMEAFARTHANMPGVARLEKRLDKLYRKHAKRLIRTADQGAGT